MTTKSGRRPAGASGAGCRVISVNSPRGAVAVEPGVGPETRPRASVTPITRSRPTPARPARPAARRSTPGRSAEHGCAATARWLEVERRRGGRGHTRQGYVRRVRRLRSEARATRSGARRPPRRFQPGARVGDRTGATSPPSSVGRPTTAPTAAATRGRAARRLRRQAAGGAGSPVTTAPPTKVGQARSRRHRCRTSGLRDARTARRREHDVEQDPPPSRPGRQHELGHHRSPVAPTSSAYQEGGRTAPGEPEALHGPRSVVVEAEPDAGRRRGRPRSRAKAAASRHTSESSNVATARRRSSSGLADRLRSVPCWAACKAYRRAPSTRSGAASTDPVTSSGSRWPVRHLPEGVRVADPEEAAVQLDHLAGLPVPHLLVAVRGLGGPEPREPVAEAESRHHLPGGDVRRRAGPGGRRRCRAASRGPRRTATARWPAP